MCLFYNIYYYSTCLKLIKKQFKKSERPVWKLLGGKEHTLYQNIAFKISHFFRNVSYKPVSPPSTKLAFDRYKYKKQKFRPKLILLLLLILDIFLSVFHKISDTRLIRSLVANSPASCNKISTSFNI